MGKVNHKSVLDKLLGRKVFFQGKFEYGQEEKLKSLAEAQQGQVADDLDASVHYLVLADLSAGKTAQKKAMSLNAKGASIQVLDAVAFDAMVKPTDAEILQLIRDGKDSVALFAKVTGGYYRNPAPQIRFVGEKFDSLDLSDLDLKPVEFEQCSFVETSLVNSQFSHCKRCDFSKSRAESASFGDSEGSRFVAANLKSAKISGNFADADFTSADLSVAELHGYGFNFRRAKQKDLIGCIFRKANLKSAKFQQLALKSPDFDGADLSQTSFHSCSLASANLRSANLQSASLVGCDLAKANLSQANLKGANLGNADLTNATLDGADLAGCNLRGAKLAGVDLSKAKNHDPKLAVSGSIGPALTELDTLAQSAKSIALRLHLRRDQNDDGEEVNIDTRRFRWGMGLVLPQSVGGRQYHQPNQSFSDVMLQLANLAGNRIVRFETVDVSSTKSPKAGRELRELVINAISEAFAQPVPAAAELAAATKTHRDQQREQSAADRERRELAKQLAEKEKVAEKKQIAKKIAKEVGKVTDIATFLKALELRADKSKIDKATKMLKAERFKLFNDITEEHLSGVVKSQTDPDLVYACRIEAGGQYACCTQNLNICGGLRGSICKHLLVLIIGLVKAGGFDPSTIDAWVAKSHDVKPELNKETMGDIFIRYKGAEAGEVDWRPTETVPEDYYAL